MSLKGNAHKYQEDRVMNLWTEWLGSFHVALSLLSSQVGLGMGLSIVVLTVVLRSAILPLSWSIAYRGAIRQKKMGRLEPKLKQLKDEFGREPKIYGERLVALYREQDIQVMDWRSLLAALVQMPVFLGMYQVLRAGVGGARFLWVETLARPDPWFAVLAGMTTMLMVLANPDMPQAMRVILVVVPSVLAFIAALKFCSALAVYWTASNCYSAIQTRVLHFIVAKRIKSGLISI
jgi:YidC/Oxa1 family membrane protein insertase